MSAVVIKRIVRYNALNVSLNFDEAFTARQL